MRPINDEFALQEKGRTRSPTLQLTRSLALVVLTKIQALPYGRASDTPLTVALASPGAKTPSTFHRG
jgi:hypothetical protein